jgi:hypothetical protein
LTFVPSLACDPSSTSMPSFLPKYSNDPILVYSLDDDREDENTPLPTHLPIVKSIEHEPTLLSHLPRWVYST